jgi:hypothetical protein
MVAVTQEHGAGPLRYGAVGALEEGERLVV